MIHEVDILQYLFGPIIRVSAEQTMSLREHEVEEGAAILLRFDSGVVGTFIISDATPSPHYFESGTGENPMIPQSGKDFYRILGTCGTLSLGDMRVSSFGPAVGRSWTHPIMEQGITVGTEVPFDEQIAHFVRVVHGEEQPRCTGADGLSALVVCDAIKRSMSECIAIDIPG